MDEFFWWVNQLGDDVKANQSYSVLSTQSAGKLREKMMSGEERVAP